MMQDDGFAVDQIDHVELFVPDRYQAAEWYRRVLGLKVVAEYEHWASDPRGPLMISSDGGHTKLALFQGTPQGERDQTKQLLGRSS
jgi:catechol 2,3-dioxygenase-like lactoylglutathione lyase family enzyme